jgi:hypothetical protein
MVRFLETLILMVVVGYCIWPYYSLFRLDRALTAPATEALAPWVELSELRAHYKERVGAQVRGLIPQGSGDAEHVLRWLSDNLTQLGDAALDQAITLEWVQSMLQDAIQRRVTTHPGTEGHTLIGALDFAFFESWDRFVVRIGELGEAPTFIILTPEGGLWRVTDITE